MKNFFYPEIQKKIESNETDPIKIKKFLDDQEIAELLDFRKKESQRLL